jgi:hypothetical protein
MRPEGSVFGRELNNCVYGRKATIRLNPLTLFRDQDGTLLDQLEPRDNTALLNCRCKTSWMRLAGNTDEQRRTGGLFDGNARCNLSFAAQDEVPIARA